MKNTRELRDALSIVFNQLKEKKINTEEARSFTSISNAMVKTAMAEADYNKYLQKTIAIPFLQTINKI